MTRRFVFIGVTTGESSMMRIFPRWRDALALDPEVELVGRDLPIHAPPEQYRETVEWLRDDPDNVGALVTTHKIDIYHAARDLFNEVDDYAQLLGEVSCIARRNGRLLGWATDPISAGRTLERMLGPGYFGRTGAEVLCFGAGGAGNAITAYLLTQSSPEDRPRRIVVTDPNAERLRRLEVLHGLLDSGVPIEYVQTGDPQVGDQLTADLPQHSLVINASGMGKDRPGSPVSDAVRFPLDGIAWELNYRGELGFLHGAWEQRQKRRLRVEDGWTYFIFGWTTVMEGVFDRRITADELTQLADSAAFARPHLPTTGAKGVT
jgi:shikimate 5-dehydrogenase